MARPQHLKLDGTGVPQAVLADMSGCVREMLDDSFLERFVMAVPHRWVVHEENQNSIREAERLSGCIEDGSKRFQSGPM